MGTLISMPTQLLHLYCSVSNLAEVAVREAAELNQQQAVAQDTAPFPLTINNL